MGPQIAKENRWSSLSSCLLWQNGKIYAKSINWTSLKLNNEHGPFSWSRQICEPYDEFISMVAVWMGMHGMRVCVCWEMRHPKLCRRSFSKKEEASSTDTHTLTRQNNIHLYFIGSNIVIVYRRALHNAVNLNWHHTNCVWILKKPLACLLAPTVFVVAFFCRLFMSIAFVRIPLTSNLLKSQNHFLSHLVIH